MMKKPMTKDIAETKCKIHKAGDTIQAKVDGIKKTVTYKSHKIITDDEGFIIGVQTEWQ